MPNKKKNEFREDISYLKKITISAFIWSVLIFSFTAGSLIGITRLLPSYGYDTFPYILSSLIIYSMYILALMFAITKYHFTRFKERAGFTTLITIFIWIYDVLFFLVLTGELHLPGIAVSIVQTIIYIVIMPLIIRKGIREVMDYGIKYANKK